MDQPEAPSEGGGHTLEGALLDGRYRVASALGAGGMATVYLAQDERLDRSVVVKTPHPALAVEKDFRARFDREIRNLTKIEHPHVLKVHDTGSFRDLPYAVMQHLSGGSLADRLRAAGGRQPAQVVLPWLLQVADALDHIHSRGFVHRDIKPGNILYDDAGNVVVADFGIAKAMGHLDTGITATGVTPGSPGYMAPEVLKGGELGPAYDQYSLAVCVYEALCGQLPYPGETPLELLAGLMSRSAADLSPLVPEIPPDATAAVMRALARDPAKRFATCTEFAKSFQTALGVPTMQVFPEQFRTALRRKRWMRAGMAAASLGVAAALGARAVSLLRGDARPSFPPDAPRAGTAPSAPSAPPADVPTWELVTPEGAPPDVKVSPLQIETAKRLGLRVWFENELGMRFVLIPPGKFTMGSPESEVGRIASEKQHEVLIDAPYYMQTTELTNGQMRRLVPEHANPQWSGADTNADDLPAGSLTKAKVDALTRQMSRRAGRAYAAPTSLQWEYACRAGTTTSRFWGDDEQGAARFVNIADQSAAERWPHWRVAPVRDGHAGPAPAGSMDANPWGLREILGNVAEFAVGSDGAEEWRGGCWPAAMECCRAAATFDPTGADPLLGLRLVAPVSFQDRGPTPWPLVRPEGAPPDVLVSQFQIDEAAKLGVPVWFENSVGISSS
ncbi:MAG: Serine/threonine-protein kinase PknD [Planctomycetes bacterium]|nr:Serine/threonine-protein kinase PknD [Planctomycetota bacterium]